MTPWIAPTDPLVAYHWQDSTGLEPAHVASLLAVAEEVLREYAPTLPLDVDGAEVAPPERYRLAVILEAREIHTAQQRGEADVIDLGEYAIRARPLSSTVAALLRPRNPRPRFGGRTA